MPSKTSTTTTSDSSRETLSLTALIVSIVVSNAWFFSQVTHYVG